MNWDFLIQASPIAVDPKQLAELIAAVAAATPASHSLDYGGIAVLIAAVAAAVVSLLNTVATFRNSKQIEQVRVNTDGKLTDLMTAVKAQSSAEGELKGRKDMQAQAEAAPAATPLGVPVPVQVVNPEDSPVPVKPAAPAKKRPSKK